jgi:hypothetical protein
MTKKNGLPPDLAKNKKLVKLIESGEAVYHPAKRGARARFKPVRLPKGVRIERAAKSFR